MADLFSLELDGLPHDAKVVAFRGAEAISQPYRFDVSVIVPNDIDGFDPDAALGTPATLRVLDAHHATRARFVGEVHGAEFVHASPRHLLYRVEIRPKLWRLATAYHSRVWVDKAFPDIVQEVLRAHGVTDIALSLSKRYATLPHVCQYQESDLAFVSRWMEREGVYFYFEHVEGGELLHITDDKDSLPETLDAPLRFFATDDEHDTSATESVRDFRRLQAMQAQAARLFDYDYLRPSAELSAESPIADGSFGRRVDFGDNLRTPADARRLAQVRAEEQHTRRTRYRGDGRVFGLAPGLRFDLDEHPVASLNGSYYVTELEHRGSNLAEAAELRDWLHDAPGADAPEYRASFVALRADVAYRPPLLTPWPRVRGLAFDSQPAYSRDGAWLAYVSDRSGAEKQMVLLSKGLPRDRFQVRNGRECPGFTDLNLDGIEPGCRFIPLKLIGNHPPGGLGGRTDSLPLCQSIDLDHKPIHFKLQLREGFHQFVADLQHLVD